MQRSQKYDWFKGSKNEKDKKKDVKQAAKTTWKFTKIFLIFFVLFISLWGCVQGFTLKQSSFVGKGTEFYLSESEIPPHIQEWQETSKTDPTDSTKEIYSLKQTGSNIWLNRQDELKNRKDLEAVHKELKNQGVKSMADAYKGVNEANRIIDANKKETSSHAILFDTNGKPIVSSTESKMDFVNNAANKAELQTLRDNFNKTFIVADVAEVPADPANNKPKIEAHSTTTIKTLTGWDSTKNVPTYNEVSFFKRDPKVVLSAVQQQIVDQRDWFRLRTLESLNKNNWIYDALTLQNNYEIKYVAPAANAAQSTIDKDNTNRDLKIAAVTAAQTNALKVLDYLGYGINGNNQNAAETTKISEPAFNNMPGITSETYVPILTWSQAWTRGVGPFYGLAVFPISKFTTAVADAFPLMSGWETLFAMIIVIFVLRFIGFLVTIKSSLQQTKMQELNLKKAAIDAKYAPYKGNKQMQNRQRQEVAEMYKKEGVSPMGAFTSVLIVMPLFLAIWRVIGSTPHIKSTIWYGINFSATSWRELFAGHVIYLPLMVLALGFSIGSQLFPKLLTRKRDKLRGNAHLKQAMKKNDKTQIIIMIITAGMSLIFTAGLQVYWIVVSVWQIVQHLMTHEILKYRHKKVRQKAKA